MNTTSIVIEHLVIGFQALTWMALSVLALFGYHWIDSEWFVSETVAIILSLLIVYPLGIFVDEMADRIFMPLTKRLRRKREIPSTDTVYRLLILLNNDSTTQYFQYLRSRIRVARSSTLNFALITIASVWFSLSRLSSQLAEIISSVVFFEIMAGIFLTLLALFSALFMNATFAKRLKWGYDALRESNRKQRQGAPRPRRRITNP
jgi:hypothetical protein